MNTWKTVLDAADGYQEIKIVDDTFLNNYSIEEAFYHLWEFLQLCADNV